MALIKCKQCDGTVADDAETCPSCGTQLNKTGCCGWIIGLIILVIVLFAFQALPMLLYMLAMIF
jgi:RNA polymerase subunit RPABC4/transcription elongation factor Spt4